MSIFFYLIQNIYLELLDEKEISDVLNGKAYERLNEKNDISLLFFVDDVQFSKSSSKKIFSLQAQILNLPSKVRGSVNNIICLCFYVGPKPNFNVVYENYLIELKNILKNGIFVDDLKKHITVGVHACIADAPARARIANMKLFKGEYGCMDCLNPGVLFGKKRVYENKTYPLRDTKNYKDALDIVIESGVSFEGVKGETFLSNLISFPNAMILDYMHLSLERSFKSLLTIWLDKSNRSQKDFYIGKYIFNLARKRLDK